MKVLNDILKVNNRYSLKRVIAIITFVFIMLLASFIGISDYTLKKEISEKPYLVFTSLLFFLTGIITVNEAGKKITDKESKTEQDA